ncbi:MAG: wax ester/triacylglycerol synthase family O-acyltransferase [Nevskia sp.]|nr:wax ester/triacylglycerol synthase family O-acyltransferase [Nevskia sp.]
MNAPNLTPKRLSALDATFLSLETRHAPMHVGSLQVFSIPAGAPEDFVKNIVRSYRSPRPLSRPWNLKLVRVPLSTVFPAVAEASFVDMDYHVRHTALPAPGGERELGELISHLHSQLLDRSRPLWTCHVIEGLANDRFAIYTKIHHALTDGVNGIRMLARSLATTQAGQWSAPWHVQRTRKPKGSGNAAELPATASELITQCRSMAHAMGEMVFRKPGQEPVRRPFEAPRSALNTRVTAARRVATQQLDLERLRRIAKRSQTSVNDVFLALCSAAMRRHLKDACALPTASLIAGVPVSLRDENSADAGGNAVGFIWAALATDVADPAERLRSIHASMQVAKDNVRNVPPAIRQVFTMLTMAPAVGVLMSGLGAYIRPPMNVTISNVPGPEGALYLNEARLEAMYPVSIPFQGQGLNVTCISYAGLLNVGFTGSRDCLPHLQRLAVYAGEALEELDAAFPGKTQPKMG